MAKNKRAVLILSACALINLTLGSMYAWSVFLEPLQNLLNASRSEISIVFSATTICFTLTMMFGAPLYQRLHPTAIATGTLLIGAIGLATASRATSLPLLVLGYGVLFGIANGFGYNLCLQLVGNELQKHAKLAIAFVVSCYAGGSVGFAPIFSVAIARVGVQYTLLGMGLLLLIAAFLTGFLLKAARVAPGSKSTSHKGINPFKQKRTLILLWLGFAFSALAGLIVISHAAGIVSALDGTKLQIALGVTLISIGNMMGRLSAGWLNERFSVRRILIFVMLASSLVLLLIVLLPIVTATIILLSFIGYSYGINATTYPIAARVYYGKENMTKVFGKIFSAWGVAGLTAPWLAGRIFDGSGKYMYALILAAGVVLAGGLVSIALPKEQNLEKLRCQRPPTKSLVD